MNGITKVKRNLIRIILLILLVVDVSLLLKWRKLNKMISFNDGLIWFCKEGGCTKMPQWFAYISIFLIILSFGVGYLIGHKQKEVKK